MQNKIVWIHSYDTRIKGGGVFMFQQLDYLKKFNIQVTVHYLSRLFNPIIFLSNYFKLRIAHREHIVHAQYGSGTAFFTSLLITKKKIVSIRGSDWYTLSGEVSLQEKLRSKISHFLTLISLNRFDEIIVMSERMKMELTIANANIEQKIRVVTDGIDLDMFYPIDKVSAKNSLGFELSRFLVGVGSIVEGNPIKRISLVKKAVEILSVNYPIELFVLTDIEHSEMNLYVNCCDVIVLTSIYEGWPNIIKEGLACNVPFISTDVSDLHLITNDKSSGCFITSDNVEHLAHLILDMYKAKVSGKNWDTRKFVLSFELSKTLMSLISSYKI